MTEAEWLACAKPNPMLEEMEWQGKLSSRKQQLWVCACVKRIGHLLLDERLRAGVIARDMYADDLITTHQLRAAEETAQKAKAEIILPPEFGHGISGILPVAAPAWAAFAAVAAVEGPGSFRWVSINVLEAMRCEASRTLQGPVPHEWSVAVAAAEWEAQANLVRDVFGNPYRPASLTASWLTPTVIGLTEAIYQEEDFDTLPILTDALEEAGCTDGDVLNHCRAPGPHVRGCWIVDLLLRKA